MQLKVTRQQSEEVIDLTIGGVSFKKPSNQWKSYTAELHVEKECHFITYIPYVLYKHFSKFHSKVKHIIVGLPQLPVLKIMTLTAFVCWECYETHCDTLVLLHELWVDNYVFSSCKIIKAFEQLFGNICRTHLAVETNKGLMQ